MRILFIFLMTIIYLNAFEILKIKNTNVNLKSYGYTYFLEEDENLNTPEKVLNNENLKLSKNNYLGIKDGPFWTQLSLKNETNEFIDLIISSDHSGVNYLDIYIFNNDILENKYLLGDMREQSKRKIVHHNSIFNLKLKPNETKTIIARFDNPGMYKINWSIKDSVNFINDDNKYILYLIIFSSIVFIISLNSLILYKIYKAKTFLVITIEAIAVFLYVLSLYGYLYQMNIGIPLILNTLFAWICIFLTAGARLIFPIFFFDMKNSYKKSIWFLYLFIGLFIAELLVLMYGQYVDNLLIGKYEFIILMTFTIYPIVLVLLALYFIIKKEKYALYYFLIQLVVTIISTIHTLTLVGILKFTFMTPYIMHAIIIFDSFFVLLLQYYASKSKYEEQVKQNEMLLEQSRFYSIGQAIGHITHQWKHPLSRISGTVTALEFMVQNDRNQIVPYIENKLETVKDSINEMKYTVDNFTNIFSTILEKSDFLLKETIQKNVISILESKITEKNVIINLDIDDTFSVNSHKHTISNIFMILIDNSIDAFENINGKNIINISCFEKNKIVHISYEDNAGGIKIKPIEKVFEYFVSTKTQKTGSGIGLALLKILITEKLYGNISVKNTKDGVRFDIEI